MHKGKFPIHNSIVDTNNKWEAVILKVVKYNLLTGEGAERDDDGSGQAFDKNWHKELAGTCEVGE